MVMPACAIRVFGAALSLHFCFGSENWGVAIPLRYSTVVSSLGHGNCMFDSVSGMGGSTF